MQDSVLGINGDLVNQLLPFDKCTQFSFRKTVESVGSLNPCPTSMRNAAYGSLARDMSLSSVFFDGKNQENMFDKILEMIPAVQIREYAQDSRIVQIQNAFAAFKKGWDAFKDMWKDDRNMWNSITNFLTTLKTKIPDKLGNIKAHENIVNGNYIKGGIANASVLHIPAVLYYEIMSARTTGYYTVPYSGKLVDSSNGMEGWNVNHGFNGLNTSEYSALGVIANFFGKNIKFNTTPTWDGNTKNDFPQIEVSFQLFNDSTDAALNNFLFLHQILPKNRFYQYHIFQQNPCVYDLKIEGYGRFYMCSGSMKCDYRGVSRRPSEKFYTMLADKMADGYKKDKKKLDTDKLIRIPDVYDFKLTFQSLLPNSLNNYLFGYTVNSNMESQSPWNIEDKSGQVMKGIRDAATESADENMKKVLGESQSGSDSGQNQQNYPEPSVSGGEEGEVPALSQGG